MALENSTLIQSGECIEFWARRMAHSDCYLRVQDADGNTLYAIKSLPRHFEFFSYTNCSDEAVMLTVQTDAVAFSTFYSYCPATVATAGVCFWEWAAGEVHRYGGAQLQAWAARDPSRPGLHFTPFKGWMNDPNGLCLVGDTYHLFYQFHPHSTDWGPMHWGHATSADLVQWTHQPVFLHPEQNLQRLGASGGAFSGSACTDHEGQLRFYYTERLPSYEPFKTYREVQKLLRADTALLKPVAAQTVLADGPAGAGCDSRDPRVWWDKNSGAYRMVLGSSIDGDPAVLLHGSPDGVSWTFISVLYRAAAHFRQHGARCVECPDLFPLNGAWVLLMAIVGYQEPTTGRQNLIYASVGTFEGNRFSPTRPLQELDFGTGCFAMQSFAAGEQRLAMAWVCNWESKKPAGSDFSGEMALPRVLTLNDDLHLCMNPVEGLLRRRSLTPLADTTKATIRPSDVPFEVQVSGALTGLHIEGRDDHGGHFVVAERDGALVMSTSDDLGAFTYRSRLLALSELRLFFDHGVIEVFANQGSVCGTRRSYSIVKPTKLTVRTAPATGITHLACFALTDR